ncbi:uncharacterized transporter slc-17.2-like isoform X1 [Haliotis cracherodii]|uniref:uncharacterized transporter slc-17.2-like isoform X1 n=2 Tax=Haliotis cracherodii TaxID=6455 RepID=UPI0039E7D4B5
MSEMDCGTGGNGTVPDTDHTGSVTYSPSEAEEEEGRTRLQGSSGCSQRWLLALMGCFGGIMVESGRAGLSVAIVCMVNDTDSNNSDPANSSSLSTEHAEFYWSKAEQSGMLSAYFYGYMVIQIPGGWLAGRHGGKNVMFFGMLIGSIASLLLPIGARTSKYLVYVLRGLVGISQGVYLFSMHTMWGKWAPPLERTKLLAVAYAGPKIGSIAVFAMSGYLCKYGFDNGWASMFYLSGGISVIWCGVWYYTVASTPSQHPWISQQEKNYITMSIGETKASYPTPWGAMLMSPATWVCVIGHVCFNWIAYTLTTNTPLFLKEVMNFDITENGLLSSMTFASQAVSAVLTGQVADYFRSKKYLSTTATRRLFQSIAFLGAGVCLLGTGFVDAEHRYVAIALLTIAMWFMGVSTAGYLVNFVDFAPRHAGILVGISNTIASLPGMVAPLLAGALTPHKSQEEWRNVFYVCAGFCVLGIVVFGTQARGELQYWAVDQVEMEVVEEQRVSMFEKVPDFRDASLDTFKDVISSDKKTKEPDDILGNNTPDIAPDKEMDILANSDTSTV